MKNEAEQHISNGQPFEKITMISPSEKCLLLGFGDIARRLSRLLLNDYRLTGVRRRPDTVDGVDTRQLDAGDESAMAELLREYFDVIVITMTPDKMSDTGYQLAYVETMRALLAALDRQAREPRLIIFVSSSSVYGQQGGEWVDETSVTRPSGYSGRRLLEAESILLDSCHVGCCVRFPGIYGPGRRRLINQILAGRGTAKEPASFSNRIHADDCAGVLAFLIERQKTQALENMYLASDCQPAPLYEVKSWLAEQLAVPVKQLQPSAAARAPRGNKRCSNQLLLSSGYQFLYPTFKEGYQALIRDLQSRGELPQAAGGS